MDTLNTAAGSMLNVSPGEVAEFAPPPLVEKLLVIEPGVALVATFVVMVIWL